MEHIKYFHTEMQKELLISQIRMNPSLRSIFKHNKDITKKIDDDLNQRLNGSIDNFYTLYITGRQGCQPKGSKVLMANGEWKNIEEIKKGDCVLSPQKNGSYKYSRVIDTTEWYSQENYLVKTLNKHKKTLYECSYNHIIPVNWCSHPRINPKENMRKNIWKIKEYSARDFFKESKNRKEHSTTLLAPPIMKFKNQRNCEIEPYTLGYYLGNGYFGSGKLSITCNDKECMDEITKHYPLMNHFKKQKSTCIDYTFSTKGELAKQLRKHNLEGKKARQKNIPKKALLSDLNYRKKLLAGLIDSHGSFSKQCRLSITSMSKQLIEDISWIASSLGLRNNISSHEAKIGKKSYGLAYQIFIYVNNSNIPTKCERKNSNKNSKFYLSSNRIRIDLEPSEPKKVYGIMLDSISKLYITDNWAVTHNSLKSSVGQEISKKHDPTFNQAERVAFQYEEHEQHFSNSKPKQSYIIDEAVFQFGVGSTRLLSSIQEKIETLRKRQNPLTIISPERKFFSEDLFTYTLETIDNALIATCPNNQQAHEPRNCNCYMEKTCQITKAYVRLAVKQQGIYIGFYICEINWNDKDYLEYEKRKHDFMNDIVSGHKKRTDYEEIASKLLEKPEIKEYKNQIGLKLFIQKHKPNLTTQETNLVAQAIKILRNREEAKQ